MEITDVSFGLKVGQICPKWDKFRTFWVKGCNWLNKIHLPFCILAQRAKMNWNLIWICPGFVYHTIPVVYLYLYKYENVCLSVCLFVRVFLSHLESDWDTLWHNGSFRSRKGSKTIIFQKSFFFRLFGTRLEHRLAQSCF